MNSIGKISIAAFVALCAGGGIVAASADTDEQTPAAAGAIVDAAVKRGGPVTLTPVQQRSLTTAEGNGFRPQSERAVQVGPDGERWTLVPAADGGVCQITASGVLGCATADSVVAGKASLTLTAPPANDAELAKKRLAVIKAQNAKRRAAQKSVPSGEIGEGFPMEIMGAGEAVIRGLAPAKASTVEAVGGSGAVAATAPVTNGVYTLTVSEGEPAALRFRAADGTTVATASR